MSSWRRYPNESKHASKYNQKPRTENLRSFPSNVVVPISYTISKPNTSFDVSDKSVRLTINFDIEPQFLDIFERAVEPVLPETTTEPAPESVPEPVLVTEPDKGPDVDVAQPQQPQTHHWPQPQSQQQPQQAQQIMQPQYIRQPNTLVGLYNNTNTGVVTVIRSPRIARPYH